MSYLGRTLGYLHTIQQHGITLGVGTRQSAVYFVRSNDQGTTQDSIPGAGGEFEQYVGPCASGARPCLVWYPEGLLACFVVNSSGDITIYHNTNSGYGQWEAIA